MIKIDNMYNARLAIQDKECITYGDKLSPVEEHAIAQKILKMMMQLGINCEVSTDAKFFEERDY
jgi:hypothetical protein